MEAYFNFSFEAPQFGPKGPEVHGPWSGWQDGMRTTER